MIVHVTDAPAPGSCSVFIDNDGEIVVDGVGTIANEKHFPLAATERTLVAADIDSLASAARDPDRYQACVPSIIRIVLGDEDVDPYYNPDQVWLVVDETSVNSAFEVTVKAGTRRSDSDYLQLLDPPLAAFGCRVDALEFVLWDGSEESEAEWIDWNDPADVADVLAEGRYLRVTVGGSGVLQLIRGARVARALLLAVADGPLDAAAAAHLARAGNLEAIVGLPESDWLEVKSRGYHLREPGAGERHKLELAQDVARFANGDVAAVLLIGYRTSAGRGDDEVITGIAAVKLDDADPEQHRKVIDARVHPTVEGLRVDRVSAGSDRAVLVIEVPAQPDFLKPFLVHGAVVDDRVDGSFISIVKRRGSHSIVADPSQIHAQLAAGRALLRDGTRPADARPSATAPSVSTGLPEPAASPCDSHEIVEQ